MGRDVFRRCVQTVRHRIILGRPIAGKDIVGATAQQQIESVALSRDDCLPSSVIMMRHRPSAVAIVVFVRPTGPLDHAVQRDVFDDSDRSHGVLFS